MAEFDVDSIVKLESEAQKIAMSLRTGHQTVLTALDPSLHDLDMRSTSLQRLNSAVLTYLMGLVVIKRHLLVFDWWDANWGSGLTNDQKMTNTSGFYSNLSFSTYQSAFSILEGFIRQVLFAFNAVACSESTAGYEKVRIYLFRHHLDLEHSDYASFFKLISTIRNCIHNVGVYRSVREKELIIEHSGMRYTFLHNKPPNCLQPESLLALLSEMGGVIFDIVNDSNVMELERVEDLYENLGSYDTVEPNNQ